VDIVNLGICRAQNIEIRLALNSRFLHAKLLRFRAHGRLPVYVLGSANFSNAAFNQNDEVMIVIKGRHPGLNDYIEHVIKDSASIDNLPNKDAASSWREFLRNAYLYFRPSRNLAFSIDPFVDDEFGEIAACLRKEVYQPLPFAETNVLSLNLIELLELNVPASTKLKFQLPTYAVETDYGYWVPEAYVDFVQEKLQESSGPKRRALEERGSEIRNSDETYVRARVKIYLDEVQKRLASGSKSLRLSKKQNEAICAKIIHRVAYLAEMLGHSRTLERLSQSLVGGPIPEFWEDAASVDRFFDGFCDDIVSKINEPKGTPRIVKHLATKFQIYDTDDYSKCRQKIEDYFSSGNCWQSNNWP
jgi:PLD-like domain